MKNLLSISVGCFLFIVACNETTSNQTTNSNADTSLIESPATNTAIQALCFTQQNANDTFQLSMKVAGRKVTGTLDYLMKEKDSNRGEIEGSMNGDTLIADYTFNSEGVSSVRQVAFLVQGDKATEGYADLDQKDGKMVFKDVSKISFGKGVVMTKTDCKQ